MTARPSLSPLIILFTLLSKAVSIAAYPHQAAILRPSAQSEDASISQTSSEGTLYNYFEKTNCPDWFGYLRIDNK